MSKFDSKEKIGSEAIKILDDLFNSDFIDFVPFGKHDSTADIDGHIRLRDGVDTNSNEFLLFQSKGKTKIKNGKYPCSKKVLDFLYTSTVPVILFVVDTTTKEAFWFFPEKERKDHLHATAGKTLDLSNNRIETGSSSQIRELWGKFAKQTDYNEQTKSILEIQETYTQNVTNVVALFSLVKKIKKEDVPPAFKKVLGVDDAELTLISKKLVEKEIILSTENMYIVENEKIATDSIFQLLDTGIDLEKVIDSFDQQENKKNICKTLSGINHERVDKFFKNFVFKTNLLLKEGTTNDELFTALELIEEFAFRVPDASVNLIKNLVNTSPIAPVIIHRFEDRDMYGKDNEDLLGKAISILKDIRYFKPKEIFDLLIKLNKHSSRTVLSHVAEAFKNMAEYNLPILKQVGYGPQLLLVNTINEWSPKKINDNRHILFTISEALLEPSFEGTSWDKNTMTRTSGALSSNGDLRKIRSATIGYIKKLYDLSKNIEEKKRALFALQHVTQMPYWEASDDLKKMIYEDMETLIKIYDNIIDTKTEDEIIKEIDKNAYWFNRWHKDITFKGLKELKEKIANNSDYAIFKTFVGYDSYLLEDGSEDGETREQQVKKFACDISEENYNEWKKKILKIIKNYLAVNGSEYIYFNKFLFLLGENNPKIALRIAREIGEKLNNFLQHLIAGLWQSNPKLAEALTRNLVREGKNLDSCADALGYGYEPKKINFQVASIIFDKAKKIKDKEALRSIVRISYINYPKNKKLKRLFIEGARELIKLGDTWWIQNIWHRNNSLLDNITSTEVDVLLKGLMLMKDIEYHGEEILAPITSRFPEKVINFFLERVKEKGNRKYSLDNRYTAIPYNLQRLSGELQKKEKVILPLILSWYTKGTSKTNWLYRWEASHFIEKIFPNAPSALIVSSLIKFVKSKDRRKLNVTLSILNNYQTSLEIWPVCKEIITNYHLVPDYKKLKGSLFGVLANVSGSYNGEDGLLKIYENKKVEAENFKTESKKELEIFKAEYLRMLDERIEYEKKRVAENIALRDKGLGW